ncbi:MAG: hypothetical protein HY307_02585 [Arcobacter sp.]|nr:hypothetical protein [Arcobacter sp.]
MLFSNTKDTTQILNILDNFEAYLKNDTNKMDLKSQTNDRNLKKIEEKIISLAKHIQDDKLAELRIFGEMMLVVEKLSDGYTDDLTTQISNDEKVNYLAYSVNEAIKNIKESLDKVIVILHQFENNDYRTSIDESLFRGGQFRELLTGINKLQKGITSRVLQSYKIGLTLEHQSSILQTEVEKLTKSTMKQSSAVEETLDAANKITSNINRNTQIINKILEESSVLKESANKSVLLTKNTTTSMDNINTSTQAVYESISEIAKIAFQTNILSLNAAVEAATAGEAGKGFAVVAQEVRSLANRSADVASTIKKLMDELKNQTITGHKSSLAMGEEFDTLNLNIENTLKSLDSIAQASREQSRDIQLINSSIQNIDLSTKNNASSTENVNHIAIQTYNVACTLVNANKDINFEGKEAIETPDEIIKSIFTNKKI